MERGHFSVYGEAMTKPSSNDPAPQSDRDLKKFEKLPTEQKEMQQLKDEAERTAGPEKADLDEEIRRRSDEEE